MNDDKIMLLSLLTVFVASFVAAIISNNKTKDPKFEIGDRVSPKLYSRIDLEKWESRPSFVVSEISDTAYRIGNTITVKKNEAYRWEKV